MKIRSRRILAAMLLVLFVVLAGRPAVAVVLYDTADISHNTTAPGGALVGSGWQYQGYFGSFLGTMVGPKHFITAAHVGTSPTQFVNKAVFNGTASDVTYTVDMSADGDGSDWFWTLPGTDLRIFQIEETFSSYAPLYAGSDEGGKELVVMGRGTRRGDAVYGPQFGSSDPELKGWKNGAVDNAPRWGRNVVAGIATSSVGELLVAQFNSGSTVADEAHLTAGDSGGAVFIEDGGTWKLAGINYAVDGAFDLDADHASGVFQAALFDMGGLYIGSNSTSWQYINDSSVDIPSSFYASRISASAAAIEAITAVPEPGTGLLLVIGTMLGALFGRRRRR